MKFDISKKLVVLVAVMFMGLFLFGCTTPLDQGQNLTDNTTIANPASVYCIQNGGLSNIVTAADGSQTGICVFSNGSQCDEWAYYRGECPPTTVNTNQTINQTVSANMSDLVESDFIVLDDSMPNLLIGQDLNTPPE